MPPADVFTLQRKIKGQKPPSFMPQNAAHVVNQPQSMYHNTLLGGDQPSMMSYGGHTGAVAGRGAHTGATQGQDHSYGPPDPWMHGGQLGREQTTSDPNSVWNPANQGGGGANDAWIAQAKAALDAQIALARNQTAASNRTLLQDFGNVDAAKASGLFNPTQLAAMSAGGNLNPLTWMGNENQAYQTQGLQFNEGTGLSNTFYGGARAYGLGALGKHHLDRISQKALSVQRLIDAANATLAANIADWTRQFVNSTAPAQSGG